MKIKPLLLLSTVVALAVSSTAIISTFTPVVSAQPVHSAKAGKEFSKLNLTDDQKAKIKQINEAARQQMKAVLTPDQQQQLQQARQQKQKPNLNLTADQKAQLKAIRQNTRSQIQAVLTPQQQQQLQQMRQQRRSSPSQ